MATTTLKVRDETASGEAIHEISLDFLTEHITVRELMRSRVHQEVKDYNGKQPEFFRGLVQPTDAEQTLNGYRMKKRRPVDWEKQTEKAIEAFEKNRILILIDDRQAESLDERIEVATTTRVSFLRLMPLVGG